MSTCSPTVGAHVRPWEMINNQRPPRRGATYEKASHRGNGGSIMATKGYLHTAISPPRCCRTYAIAPRSVLIAPRPDVAFDRTYRWPLPNGSGEETNPCFFCLYMDPAHHLTPSMQWNYHSRRCEAAVGSLRHVSRQRRTPPYFRMHNRV